MEPRLLPLDGAQENHSNAGRSAKLEPGENATLLRVRGGDEAGAYMTVTLDLSSIDAENEPSLQPPEGIAIIKWGNAGHQGSAEVDFKKGAMITVPASWLDVDARNDEQPGGAVGRFGAFVGYFQRPHSRYAATRTGRTGQLLAAASVDLNIPFYAMSVNPQRRPVSAAMDLDFLDRSGALITSHFVAASAEGPEIPIPNAARTVRITNPNAFAIAAIRLIFNLSL